MTEWATPREDLDRSHNRLRNKEIIGEVWELAGVRDDLFLDMLGPKDHHTTGPLNERLQELVESYTEYNSVELCSYLRYSSQWKDTMPAWAQLRDLAYQQTIERNCEQFAKQVFIGMLDKD